MTDLAEPTGSDLDETIALAEQIHEFLVVATGGLPVDRQLLINSLMTLMCFYAEEDGYLPRLIPHVQRVVDAAANRSQTQHP